MISLTFLPLEIHVLFSQWEKVASVEHPLLLRLQSDLLKSERRFICQLPIQKNIWITDVKIIVRKKILLLAVSSQKKKLRNTSKRFWSKQEKIRMKKD